MKIDVLTLFPEMFGPAFSESIIGKARQKQLVRLRTVNFREYSGNKHGSVDDAPYGGGGGMVLKPEPIFSAVEHLLRETEQTEAGDEKPRIIMMCPQGERFTQAKAQQLAEQAHLIFLCGHYEGFDERIRRHLVTDELSIGDFVLTGGEIPAMAVIDSVVRLLPGVLGNEHSAALDSFADGLLEYPQYTRPADFRGWAVPEVLLSGDRRRIEQWRKRQALYRTWSRRPDLLAKRPLSAEESGWLEQFATGQVEQER